MVYTSPNEIFLAVSKWEGTIIKLRGTGDVDENKRIGKPNKLKKNGFFFFFPLVLAESLGTTHYSLFPSACHTIIV